MGAKTYAIMWLVSVKSDDLHGAVNLLPEGNLESFSNQVVIQMDIFMLRHPDRLDYIYISGYYD